MKKYVWGLLILLLVGVCILFFNIQKSVSWDLFDIIKNNSGFVFLSSKKDFDYWQALFYHKDIDLADYSEKEVSIFNTDQALVSELSYWSGELKTLDNPPIYIVDDYPHDDPTYYPRRSMYLLSGAVYTFYDVFGDVTPIFSFTYPRNLFEKFTESRWNWDFISKSGTILSLTINKGKSPRPTDEDFCFAYVPNGSMFPGGWGLVKEEKASKIINWHLRYVGSRIEDWENEFNVVTYSYSYGWCKVREGRAYILNLVSSNPIEEDLIAGIEKELIVY